MWVFKPWWSTILHRLKITGYVGVQALVVHNLHRLKITGYVAVQALVVHKFT